MTYAPDEQPKTYSSDRAGLMEAAQSLVEREEEHDQPEPASEPVEIPDAPPAEDKPPISLNDWKKERTAEREAFERFRKGPDSSREREIQDAKDALARANERMKEVFGSSPDEEVEEAPTEPEDPDDLLIAKLTEPNGTISPEDYQRALDLGTKRLEAKLYEAQVANANAVHESRSRMQAASSTFGILQQQLRGEFQKRFGADLSDEAAIRGVLENPQLAPQAAQFINESNRVLAPHAHELQQHQAQLAEANAHWGQYQDADFERRVAKQFPELKGEARDRATQRAVELLHSEGLSDEDISGLWNGGAVPFRHAAMQSVLLKAVLWDQAQEKKATAIRKPVPQVLRPGLAGPRQPDNMAEIQAALAAVNKNPSVRNVARLRLARERART